MKVLKLNSSTDLKNEGKSFYWASFFLSKKTKTNAGLLYSICRYFDNIADETNKDKTEFLINSINEIKNDKKNDVHIFLKKNSISIDIFSHLIDGFILDQRNIVINDLNELINYSYFVAGTVGLMMSKIIGVTNKSADACAIDLGIAMQLTNIARDVYEDAKMKRIYLPSNLLQNINISILDGKIEPTNLEEEKISSAINSLIDLSDKFYMNGYSGLKYIPIRARLAIFIAANIYRGIGSKIRGKGKKYLKERVYLTSSEKFLITLKAVFLFIFIPFLNYKYIKIRNNLPNENL